jgi:hypothetical protein
MEPYNSDQLKFFYCEPLCTKCNKLFKYCEGYYHDYSECYNDHLVSDTEIYIPLYYTHHNQFKVTGFVLKGSEVESLQGVQNGDISFKISDREFIYTINQITHDCRQILKTVKQHYYPDICTSFEDPIKNDILTLKVDLTYQQTVFTDGQLRPLHKALLNDVHIRFLPEIHFKGIHVTPHGAIFDLEVLSAMVTYIQNNIQPKLLPIKEIIIKDSRDSNIIRMKRSTIIETDEDIYYSGCHDYYDYKINFQNHWTLDDFYQDSCEDFFYHDDYNPEEDLEGPWKFRDIVDDILGIDIKDRSGVEQFFSNKSIVMDLFKYWASLWFKYIDLNLKYDVEICKQIVRCQPESFAIYLPLQMRWNPDILTRVNNYRVIPKQVWSNKDILRGLLLKQPRYLKYIDDDLKTDLDLVLVAVSVDPHYQDIYQYIHSSLMTNINSVSHILKADFYNHQFYVNNNLYKYIDPTFLSTKESALILLRRSPHSMIFRHLSLDLQIDKEIVLAAVQINGLNLQYLNPEFKAKRKITIVALEQNGMALKYVDPCFKDDVEMALIAIKNNPDAIQYVSYEVKQRIHGRKTKSAR